MVHSTSPVSRHIWPFRHNSGSSPPKWAGLGRRDIFAGTPCLSDRVAAEGLPLLLICLDQTLLGTLQDKTQAAFRQVAAQGRSALPDFPVPVGHFYARHLQLLHCPRQLRLLRLAKCGGDPRSGISLQALPHRRRRPICRWCEHPGSAWAGRGGQAPAQEPQCVPVQSPGAGYILLRTPAKSNCHPSAGSPSYPSPSPLCSSPDAMPWCHANAGHYEIG